MDELVIEDLIEGDGAEATTGCGVSVHYTGWLLDGSSSLQPVRSRAWSARAENIIELPECGLTGRPV